MTDEVGRESLRQPIRSAAEKFSCIVRGGGALLWDDCGHGRCVCYCREVMAGVRCHLISLLAQTASPQGEAWGAAGKRFLRKKAKASAPMRPFTGWRRSVRLRRRPGRLRGPRLCRCLRGPCGGSTHIPAPARRRAPPGGGSEHCAPRRRRPACLCFLPGTGWQRPPPGPALWPPKPRLLLSAYRMGAGRP